MGTLTRVMADATLPLYDLSAPYTAMPAQNATPTTTVSVISGPRRRKARVRHPPTCCSQLGNAPNMTVAQRQECRRQVEADVDAAQLSQFFRAHSLPSTSRVERKHTLVARS